MIGIERQRALEALDSFCGVPGLRVRLAEIVMRLPRIGMQFQVPAEDLKGMVDVAVLQETLPEDVKLSLVDGRRRRGVVECGGRQP